MSTRLPTAAVGTAGHAWPISRRRNKMSVFVVTDAFAMGQRAVTVLDRASGSATAAEISLVRLVESWSSPSRFRPSPATSRSRPHQSPHANPTTNRRQRDECRADDNSPDLIEPVIGFRHWRMGQTGLLSITCDEQWQQATMTARCLAGDDQNHHPQQAAPASACSCGIYARYTPCPRTASAPARDYVAGAVVLWGAIELHASGMRAQRCRIVALALPLSRWRKRDRLVEIAERLGLPAVRHHDLKSIAGRYGAPIPVEMRPRLSPAVSAQWTAAAWTEYPAATTIIASRQVSRLTDTEQWRVRAGRRRPRRGRPSASSRCSCPDTGRDTTTTHPRHSQWDPPGLATCAAAAFR